MKTAVASALAKAYERGLTGTRGLYQPLVVGYHRIVEDFETDAKVGMPSMFRLLFGIRKINALHREAFRHPQMPLFCTSELRMMAPNAQGDADA